MKKKNTINKQPLRENFADCVVGTSLEDEVNAIAELMTDAVWGNYEILETIRAYSMKQEAQAVGIDLEFFVGEPLATPKTPKLREDMVQVSRHTVALKMAAGFTEEDKPWFACEELTTDEWAKALQDYAGKIYHNSASVQDSLYKSVWIEEQMEKQMKDPQYPQKIARLIDSMQKDKILPDDILNAMRQAQGGKNQL